MRNFFILTLGIVSLALFGCNGSVSPSTDERARLSGVAPIKSTDANFQREVIESDQPILVDMWAPWCHHCLTMKPTNRQLAEQLDGKVKIAELNIADNAFIKEKYDVNRYPMFLIFDKGIEVNRLVGPLSQEELIAALQATQYSSHRLLGNVQDVQDTVKKRGTLENADEST